MTQPADTTTPGSVHPIEEFLSGVLAGLGGLVDVPAWSLDEASTVRVVALAGRVVAGVAELEARVVNQADDLGLPAAAGCRSLGAWLRRTTNVTQHAATAKARLAGSLRGLDATRSALAHGEIHAEQAVAIATHVDRLDTEHVSAADQMKAEAFLLAHAPLHDAVALGRLGHGILEHLDPESADEREARALERQEERARARTRFSMVDDGAGLTYGRFTVPTHVAATLRKQLHALAAPKHVRATSGAGAHDWKRLSAERLGAAFVEWVETYPASALPKIGGLASTVVVIGDVDILTGTIKAAELETGERISHTEYLRHACEAGVIPAWMNASGEVLTLGRRHRFHSAEQRLAAILEQRHCQHPSGCDVPGYLCHTHHDIPWSQGGGTDLRTTTLLCPYHHARVHEAGTDPSRT